MFSHDAPRTSVAQSIQRVSGKTQGKLQNTHGTFKESSFAPGEDVRLLRTGLAQSFRTQPYETLFKMSQWHLLSHGCASGTGSTYYMIMINRRFERGDTSVRVPFQPIKNPL